MNHAAEIELLLLCARTGLQPETGQRVQSILAAGIDWEFLLNSAARHGLMPLLYWNLKKIGSAAIPQPYLQQLQTRFEQNAQQNLLLTQELVRLLKQFEQQSITALPFKGPLLAATVYGNLALRHITDLDILVPEKEFSQAIALLQTGGYELRIDVPWESHLTRQNGFYNVDLHSSIAPRHLSYSLSLQEVWQSTAPVLFGGITVASLEPEMQLFMLCLHGTKDRWAHLNRVVDVAQLIQTQPLNWEELIAWANAKGWRRLIGIGLHLANDLLQTELPDTVQQWLQSESASGTIADQIKQQLFAPAVVPVNEVYRTLFHIRTRERLRDKLGAVWELMNHSGWFSPTPNDRLAVELPAEFGFLYYLIRPVRVLRKYGQGFQKKR